MAKHDSNLVGGAVVVRLRVVVGNRSTIRWRVRIPFMAAEVIKVVHSRDLIQKGKYGTCARQVSCSKQRRRSAVGRNIGYALFRLAGRIQ